MADFVLKFAEPQNATLHYAVGTPVTLEYTTGTPPLYDGDYEVEPRFDAQTLETKNKLLKDDVTVKAIHVSRTSNPQGGKTIYIGEV